MAKPKIRFKGYQEDWEQRKFGEIASSFEYGLNVAAKEYDGENKYIRITDIDDNTHKFLSDSLTSPDIDLTGAENYKLAKGDILFARTGASVGKSYIYRDYDGLVYYAGFLIRARIRDEYDAEFVFQNTLTDKYNKYIAVTSQRSGQPGVNAQEYSEFKIQVPKKEEQIKIGKYFQNLDHLITLHQRKCDETKKIKKYMLQKMFPQNGKKVPELRFLGFTDDWEQRKFGDIVLTRRGLTYKPSDVQADGIRVLRSSNIDEDIFTYDEDDVFVNPNAVNIETVKDNDILITSANGSSRLVGKHALIKGMTDEKAVHGGFMLLARTPNYDFINASMSSSWYTKFINIYVSGGNGAIGNLSKSDLDAQFVMLPSVEEQKQIGTYFRNLDHLITLHQRKYEELQKVKKFMLQNMFV